MKVVIALFILLGLVNTAQANSFCPSVAQLKRPIELCEDNFALGDAAMNCIEKFEAAIKVGQEKIKKELLGKVSQMKDEQSGSYQTSDASYTEAKNQLLALITSGLQARATVSEYLDQMAFPEDYEMPSVTGMSSQEYLKQEPCFAAPLEVIAGSKDLIGKMVEDLEKTALAAGIKSQDSQNKEANVTSLTKKARGGAIGSGSGSAAPKGKTIRSSDITGTEEKKNP